jgi:hypothetical protein
MCYHNTYFANEETSYKEEKLFAPNHTADRWQSWDKNPGRLIVLKHYGEIILHMIKWWFM